MSATHGSTVLMGTGIGTGTGMTAGMVLALAMAMALARAAYVASGWIGACQDSRAIRWRLSAPVSD